MSMRLKRFDRVAESSGTNDAAPFAAIEDSDNESGELCAWPTEPRALIDDVLLFHRLPAGLAERLLTGAAAAAAQEPTEDPLRDLTSALAECLSFSTFPALWRGGSLALVGPPSAGKTTLAGKLASRARSSRPMLVNTDSARVGVTAQLAEYSGVLGITLGSEGEAEALAASLPGKRRRIIIDTSGINPFDRQAVDALAALVRSARAEPVLVLPANVEPDEATEIVGALRALPIRRLLVTRLDIVRRLGGLLTAAASGGHAIVGGSITPHFTYGLRPLTPRVLARRLLSAALDDKPWRTG
jgi:flagellar biosynthesis protein FlhF